MNSEDDPFIDHRQRHRTLHAGKLDQGSGTGLVRNPNYWRTEPVWEGGPVGPAALERVILKKVDEWGTRFAMLQAGDADFAAVNRTDIAQVDPMVGEMCHVQR